MDSVRKEGVHMLTPIATIHTDLPEKFGVPRQSGVVEDLPGIIVFAPSYRNPDALRELTGFSHLWLIWQFSRAAEIWGEGWQPMVRPPRLGGNRKVGVFASRSPFRPNQLGLSVVRIEAVIMCKEEETPWNGPAGTGAYPYIRIRGVDMMDGTPLYDIKPYIPYSDSIPDAAPGYTAGSWKSGGQEKLDVKIPAELAAALPEGKEDLVRELLAADPRPPYQDDPELIYGMTFAGVNIKFIVKNRCAVVTAVEAAAGGLSHR